MTAGPLDKFSAERLLEREVEPEDAPPGYAEVARSLKAAAAPASPSELKDERNAVDSAVLVLRNEAISIHERTDWNGVAAPRRRSTAFKAKLTGLLVAATLVGSTGLAFAGALPPGLQHVASNFLSHVGVKVPDETKGATISKIATTTNATGVAKGAQISTAASNGHSQAGEHGKASTAPHGKASGHSQAADRGQAGKHGGGNDDTNGNPNEPSGTAPNSPPAPGGDDTATAPAGGGGSSSGSGHGGNGP